MIHIGDFVREYDQFSKDLYTNNNIDELNNRLYQLNQQYDEIMMDPDITDMEKNYIFSKFRKFEEINMYLVPVIKYQANTIYNLYRKYHCLD